MTLAEERARFNAEIAPALAADVGASSPWSAKGSARFAYFADDRRFVIIAGRQEGTDVDRALAFGLTYCGQRPLTLVLPRDMTFPTLQRSAWLATGAQPTMFAHDGGSVERIAIPSQRQTIHNVLEHLGPATPADELAKATTPKHLGARSEDVAELVEWAARHPDLDPGHRRGQRAWHCVGQRVLSIEAMPGGLRIRAGVHTADPAAAPPALSIPAGEPLTSRQLAQIRRDVQAGIKARLDGIYHKPDEHWLQAVVRRHPGITGIEQPALRELPAWRPVVGTKQWGRGFVDLLGLDGHGDIRLVETKLADNSDELLILQGIDYYVWALAYADALRQRLGASNRSRIVVHYVIGGNAVGKTAASPYASAQAAALHIPWRSQIVEGWFGNGAGGPGASLLPHGQMPGATIVPAPSITS